MALRNEAQRLALKARAAISITVCGQKDTAKRVFLAVAGAMSLPNGTCRLLCPEHPDSYRPAPQPGKTWR